jgi:hypothetical protein
MTQPPLPPLPIEYGYGGNQPRTSGAAVTSLVLGIVGCVPFVTGILAIIFGIVGLRKTRDPSVAGKGMAVAGLVLGIVGVLGWTGFAVLAGFAAADAKPAKQAASQFLTDLSTGNITAATAESNGLNPAQLTTDSATIASYGAVQSINISTYNINSFNGQTTANLSGTVWFAGGPKTCTFTLVKIGGVFRVTLYSVK